MNRLVLRVGVRGKYTFKEPWVDMPDTIFQCDRFATISDFIREQRINVLEDIYIKNGLTSDDYAKASNDNIRLVTLSAYGIDAVTIPEDYILKYPDTNYVRYPRTMLSIDLGLLPESISLSAMMAHIDEYIKDTINVTPKSKAHTLESGVFVGFDEFRELEESRVSGVSYEKTSWQRIRDLEIENQGLSAAIRELEDELVAR